MKTKSISFYIFLLAFGIFSCGKNSSGQQQSSSNSEMDIDIKSVYPSDEAMAEKYQRSCYICHVNESAMAPLVGSEKWQQILSSKGMEELVNNVTNGYKNMPARGQCLDCTDEDYKYLIEFMANPTKNSSN